AMRETTLFMLLVWLICLLNEVALWSVFSTVGGALLAWKTGRSAWLGWARLERLHRVVEQERSEIENHRCQEREELKALYRAKGFEGKLLDDVMDVLMADNDRLLKVMLEEELGLTLQAYEHPLKQCVGAFMGTLFSLVCMAFALFFLPMFGVLFTAFCVIGLGAVLSAIYEKNQIIPAFLWNLSIAGLSFGVAFFVYKMVVPL
ncbi:MAG: VIT1/CCC1 transporter family protein, partial [Chlamydiales bacterium]